MILDRIKEYIDHKGISIAAFERSVGMSNASFSKSLKNKGGIGSDKIENILSIYTELSPNWLLTGKGNMLKSESDIRESVSSAEQSSSSNEGAPYYDVEFQGGFTDSFNDQTIYPERHIYIPGFERVQVWCNISGHSMEPRIGHQDIIGLRQCQVQDIQFGKIYAVVLKTKRTVKILRKSNNPQMLRYVPINDKEFDEQEFPITDIINIFEVLGGVAKFF